MSIVYSDNIALLNAVTATVANTDSTPFDVSKRQLKSIQFGVVTTSGTAAFGVEVSNDGTNWIVYNRLTDNLTNTNVQGDTRVAAPTMGTASAQKIYFFPTSDYFRVMRVFVTVSGTITGATATLEAGG